MKVPLPFSTDAAPRAHAKTSEMALAQGVAQTKEALGRWRRDPLSALAPWFLASFCVTVLLLGAMLVVAHFSTPDTSLGVLPGVVTPVSLDDVRNILFRNSLVLALHSMACVAGFIAGSSMPLEAKNRGGTWGKVHDHAGRFAILFVCGATLFSLLTQAFILGGIAADTSATLHLSQLHLTILLLPHALPELIALFLPLGAWLLASRRGDWHELLAATLVTTAIAIPMVIAAAFIEVYVSPGLIRAASPLPLWTPLN